MGKVPTLIIREGSYTGFGVNFGCPRVRENQLAGTCIDNVNDLRRESPFQGGLHSG